ncbi:ABC transporter permease [Sulfolobus tengchongensis]|uniref:ABC transporter permease n=1 Tax=Sulfolobus tengchongensis TaxID=207809 RepID=A0AAX4L3H5_9CREN
MSEASGLRFMLKALVRDKAGLLGLIIVGAFLIWSLIQGILEILAADLRDPQLGYILLPHNPFKYNLQLAFHPPSSQFILGTNAEGEDILSRILYALPRDAFVALIVVFSAIIIGGILGILAGYLGGAVDEVIMRITDAFLSLPALILVIAITVPLKATFIATIVGLMVVWWPTYARFYRAQTLRIKNMDYISAAKLSGVSKIALFYRYIFLNSLDPILAYAALDFGNVILTYSTLAFLGIGITPPIPELGEMASNGLSGLPQYWWWAVFPGVTILIIVIGFVLVGDRLQDVIAGRITY